MARLVHLQSVFTTFVLRYRGHSLVRVASRFWNEKRYVAAAVFNFGWWCWLGYMVFIYTVFIRLDSSWWVSTSNMVAIFILYGFEFGFGYKYFQISFGRIKVKLSRRIVPIILLASQVIWEDLTYFSEVWVGWWSGATSSHLYSPCKSICWKLP